MTDISPGKKPEVTCMTLVNNPNTGVPIIVAGDIAGQITLLSCDQISNYEPILCIDYVCADLEFMTVLMAVDHAIIYTGW